MEYNTQLSETRSPSISFSSEESSSFDPYQLFALTSKLIDIEEEILLKQHGYVIEKEIGKTTQGEMFLASNYEELVAIKKIPKDLHETKQYIQNDFTFITDKNIVKEAQILKSISKNNDNSKNGCIINYMDSFESDDHFYVVEEYVDNSITLKEFVIKAHQYIQNHQLKSKHYKSSITFILYQLADTLNALHNIHKCCHLNISPDNILVKKDDFFVNSINGSVKINPNIQIKLKGFGVSEQFSNDNNTFECNKQFLSIDNEQYLCPDISDNYSYDGRGIDMWAFGMTMYFCYVGKYPYKIMELTNDIIPTPKPGTGYWAILSGHIKQHLAVNSQLKYINSKIMELLNMLLNVNSDKRINATDLCKHKLFSNFC